MPDKQAEEEVLAQLMAMPYNSLLRGAPPPPCNSERLAAIDTVGIMDQPPDPQIENILQLISRIFSVEIVLVCLCSSERVYISNAMGFSVGEFSFRWSFCSWGMLTPSPEVLVISDAYEDARMRNNAALVSGDNSPKLRFFAGCPLIGSSGHRLGMLIVIDDIPRSITAEQCAIFANTSELVVRELEKEAAMQAKREATLASGKELEKFMRRAVSCFEDRAVVFVDMFGTPSDTSPQPSPLLSWQALYANTAASTVLGWKHSAVAPLLWQLLELPFAPTSSACQAMCDVATQGGDFQIRGCRVVGDPSRGLFSLAFRPAQIGVLDEDAQPVGVPADVPSAPSGAPCKHYFAIIARQQDDAPGGWSTDGQRIDSCNAPPASVPFEDLLLGPLLGRGGFGRVFRGRLRDRDVAVKVCSTKLDAALQSGDKSKPWQSVEGLQSRQLVHPGIVRTYKNCVVLVQEGIRTTIQSKTKEGNGWDDDCGGWSDSGAGSDDDSSVPTTAASLAASQPDVQMEAWFLMEFCNKGTLQSGVDRGWFQAQGSTASPGAGLPNYQTVLRTAWEMASALEYLHARDLIHGDLCGGNILLKHCPHAPHGFTCKVADFGLARSLHLQARVQTATYGTVTHMPPELLIEGKLTKGTDVYAFGIMLWEMIAGARAWAGMSHTQVLSTVGFHKRKPVFPDTTDVAVKALGEACLMERVDCRPNFTLIKKFLHGKLEEIGYSMDL